LKSESENEARPLAAVIMAAGQGKRMQDPTLAKVLYPLGGKPLIGNVLALCSKIGAAPVVCIIGYGREAVAAYLSKEFPKVRTAIQEEQLGTGHAVKQSQNALKDFTGDILILSGDVPLLTLPTTKRLIDEHRMKNAMATVLSVVMPNPAGYGRIIRTASDNLAQIVEEKDATEDQKKICEINTGIYVFDSRTLFDVLKNIKRENVQGEYYLTDTLALINAQSGVGSVAVVTTNDPIEVSGINTKDQLAALETEFKNRNSIP
jgi:bifunctional UDP-N-acetylglucosamine pyrophosphorylase/glucosamine-1-phosphate N-acetyltransferase